MSTSLTVVKPGAIDRYDDQEMVKTLKDTVCKGATDSQFRMFVEICRGTGLNPFLREIWYVPNVGVMAARDGYLRVANENPNFDGMKTTVERDNNGKPIKAVCQVWRKDRSHPVECEAYYSEYKKGGNVWTTYPSAMISKVAEVLALKRSFSINGCVSEEEIGFDDTPPQEPKKSRAEGIADAKAVAERKLAGMKTPQVHDAEFTDEPLAIEAPAAPEPLPPALDWIAPMMKAFGEMKDAIGEPGYRSIMQAAGCKNKQELMKKGRTVATEVYKKMKNRRTYRESFAALSGKHGSAAVLKAMNNAGAESFDAIPSDDLDRVYETVAAELAA